MVVRCVATAGEIEGGNAECDMGPAKLTDQFPDADADEEPSKKNAREFGVAPVLNQVDGKQNEPTREEDAPDASARDEQGESFRVFIDFESRRHERILDH